MGDPSFTCSKKRRVRITQCDLVDQYEVNDRTVFRAKLRLILTQEDMDDFESSGL